MSANALNVFVKSFATNVTLLSQQKGSYLEKTVMVKNFKGNAAQVVDQVGIINANRVTQRFQPITRTDAPIDSRWCFPVDYDLAQMIDEFDKLRLAVDLTGPEVESAVYALGRAKDDEIISAYFGTAKTGVDGSTNTSFLAANVVSVQEGASTSTGMSVAKLRKARKLFKSNNVDLVNDQLFVVVAAQQEDDLLGELQVVSTDFNERPVLVDGNINRFLGFTIVHCERIVNNNGTDDQGGTSTPCPAYVKSGMALGIWNDINTSIDKRTDIAGLPWQIYAKATFGATRVEEKKVVKIWCH